LTAEAYTIFQTFPKAGRQEFTFDRHYLLYCAAGSARLEADGKLWVLPPARAALIAARRTIAITLPQPVTACSVLFDPGFVAEPKAALAVLNMSGLARELIMACRSWTDRDRPLDTYARQLFQTLAVVVERLAEAPAQTAMPVPKTKNLARALALTEERMAEALDFAAIARDVAMTERSLARRFAAEMGMTWRQALRRLRMIRALELFAERPISVTEAAFAVGYTSLSAFNAAFLDCCGETPRSYRAARAGLQPLTGDI
jgi:AraC-like DNA-binding protein